LTNIVFCGFLSIEADCHESRVAKHLADCHAECSEASGWLSCWV